MESLVGTLMYACRVVIPGHSFVVGLLECLRGARLPYHHLRLPSKARADITWWSANLAVWNGTSIIPDMQWTSAADLALETDAAGEVGFGAVFGNEWPAEAKAMSIHWKELFAIYAALLAWEKTWTAKRILFRSDNLGVVHTVLRCSAVIRLLCS